MARYREIQVREACLRRSVLSSSSPRYVTLSDAIPAVSGMIRRRGNSRSLPSVSPLFGPNFRVADDPLGIIALQRFARFAANCRNRELRGPTRSTASANWRTSSGGGSEKMLAQTLGRLEMNGFVRREVHATKLPKVEYSLSPLGCELGEHVHPLLTFVHKNANRVLKEPRKSTGARGS